MALHPDYSGNVDKSKWNEGAIHTGLNMLFLCFIIELKKGPWQTPTDILECGFCSHSMRED